MSKWTVDEAMFNSISEPGKRLMYSLSVTLSSDQVGDSRARVDCHIPLDLDDADNSTIADMTTKAFARLADVAGALSEHFQQDDESQR